MGLKIEEVARICHEANRVYCERIGDDSQQPWVTAPEWQQDSAIKGVNFHCTELHCGRTPSDSASHESWLKEKSDTGWKYGPVKNAELKEHPCFVPYEELPKEQKAKDALFSGIVKALYYAGMIDGF